jgi:hypothetical protein
MESTLTSCSKLACATALSLLLCACASLQQAGRPSAADTTRAGSNLAASDDAKVFAPNQEIATKSSIEKNHLAVSYNLQVIPGKQEQLIRISLIFRNHQKAYRHIWPHITLHDARGQAIKHYSMQQFVKMSARSQWANMYWLKRSYRIPPDGIAIGELVYHCQQINFPMKLEVRIGKESFSFTAEQQ